MRRAGPEDARTVEHLVWTRSRGDADPCEATAEFVAAFREWFARSAESHLPFLALLGDGTAVGIAWLAVQARVPSAGDTRRWCGDVQSVYVLPGCRSRGVGTALVDGLLRHAEGLGLEHVTVHSSVAAVSLYERAGFTASRELLLWSGAASPP